MMKLEELVEQLREADAAYDTAYEARKRLRERVEGLMTSQFPKEWQDRKKFQVGRWIIQKGTYESVDITESPVVADSEIAEPDPSEAVPLDA